MFVVAVHPALGGGTVHSTVESAMQFARVLAAKRGGLHVWRELPGAVGAYENLTT